MPKISPASLPASVRWFIPLLLRIYLLFLAPITFFQRSLIYHPTRCERLHVDDFGFVQKSADVTIPSHDGISLHGWLTMTGPSADTESADLRQILASGRPLVLYFPGNAGNRSRRAIQFETMGSLDAHMMLVDYRGYGDNAGTPSEAHFARDARSIWNYLTSELQVPPHRIVIYGESLGGGVATRLASDLCQDGIEPGGLILQSTFSSLVAVAQEHFSIVPVSLLLVDRFPSDQRIKNVTCPILQIHGQQDSIVSFSIGQRLFASAPPTSSHGIPKTFIVLSQADHNDLYGWNPDRAKLIDGLKAFLDDVDQRSATTPDHKAPRNNPATSTNLAASTPFDWTVTGSLLLLATAFLLWWFTRTKPNH